MTSTELPEWHNLVILTTTRDQVYWMLDHLHATNTPPDYNYDLKVESDFQRVTINVNFRNLTDFQAYQRYAVAQKLSYEAPNHGDY